tara:strand:+ start:23969 stop:24454 length:486 start_codon:yes stop_codon:yes gene_type:complete
MISGNITRFDYLLRVCVVLFAAFSPFICLLFSGYEKSISQYWNTEAQPIFIIANSLTAYYLVGIPKWRASACCLLLVTSFSVSMYPDLHNIFAIIFFGCCIYPLYVSNNYKFCKWVYFSGLLFLPFSLLVAEIVGILAICMFHLLTLNKLYSIQKERIEIS